MHAPPDLLPLLLPDASPSELEGARRVTTFVRLLSHDIRAARSPSVAVDLRRAAAELEAREREMRLAAVVDLLRAHLHAHLQRDSFAWFGRPRLDHQAAWSRLQRGGVDARGTPTPPPVPFPGESPLSVSRA